MSEIVAYICVSPRGSLIRSTIRPDPDDAWRVLRASLTEPDTLIDKGWKVRRLVCLPGETEQ